MKKITVLICATLLIFGINAQHNTYYVGHSGFGWELIVGEMVNDLAADANHSTYDYNYQFKGGTCLANAWYDHMNPDSGTDSWVELPTGNYDILIMAEQIPIQEVIYGSEWCNPNILTSVQSVDSFYVMSTNANPNTRIYLMEFHNEVDLTGPTPFETWSQMNTDMRPLWEQVADSVTLLNPQGPEVCIVPIAAAFEAMADSVISGSFPGITDWIDLFDPNDLPEATIHPIEETYYLVACVHYACIFGESPVGLTNETFAVAGWPYDPPTQAQAHMMQEIAWEIVSNDSYACLPSVASVTHNEFYQDLFEVYPNPSSGSATLKNTHNESVEITIFNLLGKKVKDNITLSANSEILLNLNQGVYTIIFETNNRVINKKLVVK